MTAPAIQPGALLEVLANIDQGTKRWRRKVQLLAVLGRWGEVHAIGVRELSERTGISHRLLAELLQELLEARALAVEWVGQGSRPTGWVVDARVQRWVGVPWLRDPAAVALYAFHVEPADNARPGQRAQGEPRSARRASQRAQGETRSARRSERRAQGETTSARRDATARGIRAGVRALSADAPQEGYLPRAGADEASSAAASSPGAADGSSIDQGEWKRLRAAVLAAAVPVAGRPKFLNGPTEQQLLELAQLAGCSELLTWLPDAPPDLGVPRLVDWLQDRWHAPTGELLEALEARAEAQDAQDALGAVLGAGGPVAGAQDAPAPPPAPWGGFSYQDAPADPAAARAAAAQARAQLRPGDPTTTEGTTHG